MTKRWIVLVCVVLVLSLLLCACQKQQPEEEKETSRTELRLLNIDIPLTKADFETVFSTTMREPSFSNGKANMFVLSEDGNLTVVVGMTEQSAEQFERMIPAASGAEVTEAPNLGDQSWWVGNGQMLMTYAYGYGMTVAVTGQDIDEEYALVSARQLMTIMLDKLAA